MGILEREWWQNYRQARIWIGMIVLFFVALVQSCSEIEHSVRGVATTARIKSVEPADRRGREMRVTMQFENESGTTHVVRRAVPRKKVNVAAGENAEIIYLPLREDRARLVSERSFFWPLVLIAIVGSILTWSIVTYRRMEAGKF